MIRRSRYIVQPSFSQLQNISRGPKNYTLGCTHKCSQLAFETRLPLQL
jgi:hypothetical protein